MQLTRDQVRHLAQLARLHLTEEEVDRFANELTDILTYVTMLGELDTTGVPETSQVTGLSNVTRADEIDPGLAKQDALLACSPLLTKDHQISIKRLI